MPLVATTAGPPEGDGLRRAELAKGVGAKASTVTSTTAVTDPKMFAAVQVYVPLSPIAADCTR